MIFPKDKKDKVCLRCAQNYVISTAFLESNSFRLTLKREIIHVVKHMATYFCSSIGQLIDKNLDSKRDDNNLGTSSINLGSLH